MEYNKGSVSDGWASPRSYVNDRRRHSKVWQAGSCVGCLAQFLSCAANVRRRCVSTEA